ncbi:thiamine pyrophosphate-binding protein [bacterium]|nr:MAG: thiamine pyrophosphate-binding protein [bacterium]
MMLAGHAMAALLHEYDIPWVAGVSGESFLPLLDGMRNESLPFLSTCHESGAAFLAVGYARASGRPGVIAVTRGPGASNALIGVHEASQANVPLVVLVGQLESGFRGRRALQEMEYTDVFRSAAKDVFEVTRPDQAPAAILAALRKAVTEPAGPVVVSIPADHFYGEVDEAAQTRLPQTPARHGVLSRAALDTIVAMIQGARRGAIICGADLAGGAAAEALDALAQRSGFGVLGGHAFPDVLPPDHPSWLGCSTIRGPRAVKQLLREADVLLVLGHRLGDRVTQGYLPLTARIAIVQPAPDIGWDEYLAAEFYYADPVAAVAQISERLAQSHDDREAEREARTAWVRSSRHALALEKQEIIAAEAREAGGVPFGAILEILDGALPDDANVVSDAGSFNDWFVRYFPFRAQRRYFGPLSGSMGYALPAAQGVQLALRGTRTVALVGDGAFLMTGLELATAVRLRLPITVVVFKNGIWGSIALHQDARFPGRRFAVDLPQPSFAALAESLGARGFSAQTTEEFSAAMEAACAGGPSLVEVTTDAVRPSPNSYLSLAAPLG